MNRLLSTLLFSVIVCNTYAQENKTEIDINNLFEFKIDSIEKKTTINKWRTDTTYFLHYTVKNISKDTLTYVTNSCFYYNHYYLKIEQQEFDLNPSGGCYAMP